MVAAAALASDLLARRRRARASRWARTRLPASPAEFWDEVSGDDDDDAFWSGVSKSPPPGQINSFAQGADYAAAKVFAATRTFAVAPWSEDVRAKPIFAVSDGTGSAAKSLAETVFMQFGSPEKAKVRVVSGARTRQAVLDVVAEAAKMAPPGSLAIERPGAMVLYTVADAALGGLLAEEGFRRGVPCMNLLEPVLQAMERCFGLQRGLGGPREGGGRGRGGAAARTVFAVSDGSGGNAYGMTCAALRQFPESGVDGVTVCSDVRSLEEVNRIVQEVLASSSLVIFTFASPGMSRFMRQQCERGGVPYADVFQPVMVALEKYLDYPPVGVPGGHDLKSPSTREWDRRPVPQ